MRLRVSFAAALGALALASCASPAPTRVVDEPAWVSVPATHDVGTTCVDVRGARACWGAGAVTRVAREVPDARDAWRCVGQKDKRACRRRRGGAGAFACTEGDGGPAQCLQLHPRLPDDGEWECYERAGAVMCRGGEPAAGVVGGRRDEAWICGAQRGDAHARVCIDFAPDRPDDAAFGACSYRHVGARVEQLCARGAEPTLGAACDADGGGGAPSSACPSGATCVDGACLPLAEPRPSCWLDKDCGGGDKCVFSTCVTP